MKVLSLTMVGLTICLALSSDVRPSAQSSALDRIVTGPWPEVVVIRTAKPDPASPFDQGVHDVRWPNVFAGKALDGIYSLLFAAVRYNAPPPTLDLSDRVFTVDVRDGTVRDVLNALVVAHGQLTWFARYSSDAPMGSARVTVRLRDFKRREIVSSWRGRLR